MRKDFKAHTEALNARNRELFSVAGFKFIDLLYSDQMTHIRDNFLELERLNWH